MKYSVFRKVAEFLREKKNLRKLMIVFACFALVIALGAVTALMLNNGELTTKFESLWTGINTGFSSNGSAGGLLRPMDYDEDDGVIRKKLNEIPGASITISVKKLDSHGNLVDVGTSPLGPGDEIYISMTFAIPAGELANDAVITYQFPDIISLSEEFFFDITRDNNADDVVGRGTVSTDGLVTIILGENIDTSIGLGGSISFDCKIRDDVDENLGRVEFPGTETTIDVAPDPNNYDVWIQKTHTDVTDEGDGKKRITYKITLNSSTGSGTDIDFTDFFRTRPKNGGELPQYDLESIVVKKYSGRSVSEGESIDGIEFKVDEEGKLIATLPELFGDERYEITYDVIVDLDDFNADIDGSIHLTNLASADFCGTNHRETTENAEARSPRIIKSSKYNDKDQTIKWTIYTSEGNNERILTDLPYDKLSALIENEGRDIQVNVECSEGKKHTVTLFDLLNGYKITDEGSHTFTFEIPVDPEIYGGETFDNTASLVGDSDSFTGRANVYLPTPSSIDWDARKSSLEQKLKDTNGDGKVDQVQMLWSMRYTFPDSDWTYATFKDTFLQDLEVNGRRGYMSVHHYQILSTLDSELKSSLDKAIADAGLEDFVSYEIIYYRSEGENLTEVNNAGDEVNEFDIIFHCEEGASEKLKNKTFTFYYSTLADAEGFQSGYRYKVFNEYIKGEVDSSFVFNEDTQPELKKEAENPPSSNNFEAGSVDFAYELGKENTITYRITYMFPENFDFTSDLVVTDAVYPADIIQIDKDSVKLFYLTFNKGSTNYGQTTFCRNRNIEQIVKNRKAIDFSDNGVMTVTIPSECYEFFVDDMQLPYLYPGIVIEYKVSLSDEQIKSLVEGNLSITNTAKVGSAVADHKTTLHKKTISKQGSVSESDAHRFEYVLDVNPEARDLVPNNDSIELLDEISMSDDRAGTIRCTLYPEIDSLTVYRFDENGNKVFVDRSEYRFAFTDVSKVRESKFQLEMTLDDETHYEVHYTYIADSTGEDGTIYGNAKLSNKASLYGEYAEPNNDQAIAQSGGGTVTQSAFHVYKTEKGNQGITLSGARFDIYKWDELKRQWVFYSKVKTSDYNFDEFFNPLPDYADPSQIKYKKGELLFTKYPSADYDINDEDSWQILIEDNTVYALVETQPPEGYILTDEVTFVCTRVFLTGSDPETDVLFWNRLDRSGIVGRQISDTVKHSLTSQNELHMNPQFVAIDNPQYYPDDPVIEKIDTDNAKNKLSGAVFDVYVWKNGNVGSWVKMGSAKTDIEGQIHFTAKSTWDNRSTHEIPLTDYSLYALVETFAPVGYKLDATPHFYCYPYSANGDNKPVTVDSVLSEAKGIYDATVGKTGVALNSISDVEPLEKLNLISNKPLRQDIGVQKIWQDVNGDGIDSSLEELPAVNVSLKQYAYYGGVYLTQRPKDTENWCEFTFKTQIIVGSYQSNVSINLLNGTGLGTNSATIWIPKNAFVQVRVNDTVLSRDVSVTDSEGNEISADYSNKNSYLMIDIKDRSRYEVVLSAESFGNYVNLNIIGEAPASFVPSGEPVDSWKAELSDENNWQYVWYDLPVNDGNGNQYVYAVEETDVPDGYNVTVENNGDNTFAVINKEIIPLGKITVAKRWQYINGTAMDGSEHPDSVTVILKRLKKPLPGYTVTFNSMGGSDIEPVTVIGGRTFMQPADPTRKNYQFAGWYKDEECTQPWNFGVDTVSSDLTLYAKWIKEAAPNEVTVTFLVDGGVYYAINIPYGTKVEMPLDPAASEGYLFYGWCYKSTWEKFNPEDDIFEDITLEARFVEGSDEDDLGECLFTFAQDPYLSKVYFQVNVPKNATVTITLEYQSWLYGDPTFNVEPIDGRCTFSSERNSYVAEYVFQTSGDEYTVIAVNGQWAINDASVKLIAINGVPVSNAGEKNSAVSLMSAPALINNVASIGYQSVDSLLSEGYIEDDWYIETELNASNNWTYTFDDLIEEDDDYMYLYYIVEESVPDGYVVSYSVGNESGYDCPAVGTGSKIIVTNSNGDIIELPSTGGIGREPYILTGSAILFGGLLVCGFYLKRKRKRAMCD